MTTSQEVVIAAMDDRANPKLAQASDGFVRKSKTVLFDFRRAKSPRMDFLRSAQRMTFQRWIIACRPSIIFQEPA